ncbi:MAG: hypothetical protein FJ319_09260 [SAR202 cluster bacterium]|nr:hypothetical protein [SAR202 cluster bacterium]
MFRWLKKRGIQFWFWVAWIVSFLVGGIIIFGMIGAQAGFWQKLRSGPPDFEVTMAGPATLAQGAEGTYVVTIKNIGRSEGAGNTPTITFPDGMTINGVVPGSPACTTTGQEIVCRLGSQVAGAQGSVTVRATAASAGAKTITASVPVSAKTRDTDAEEIGTNNTATLTTTVQ